MLDQVAGIQAFVNMDSAASSRRARQDSGEESDGTEPLPKKCIGLGATLTSGAVFQTNQYLSGSSTTESHQAADIQAFVNMDPAASSRCARQDSDEDSDGTEPLPKKCSGEDSVNREKLSETLLERCEDLPEHLMTVVADLSFHVAEMYDTYKKDISENYPPMTMARLRGMLPDPAQEIDMIWTQQQEANFHACFGSSSYRAFIVGDLPLESNAAILEMWKSITRLRRCFPTDIIGVKTYLEFATEVDVGGGVMKPNPSWPFEFCTNLTDLALGSGCGANMGLLALLIRYVVADRIDDRRQVPLDDHQTDSTFFEELAVLVRRENADRPLRDLHAEVRRRSKAAGRYLGWESNVMCLIERFNSVRPPHPTRAQPGDSFPIYEVTTTDLSTLLRAFNSVGEFGSANLITVEYRASIVTHARSGIDSPNDFAELDELRIPLLEAEERLRSKRLFVPERGLNVTAAVALEGPESPIDDHDDDDGE
ncbi:hypothetical protein F5Y19DRAFT_493302 [Xylariaceae sp. FL1651]|nr:hypothetical protein F5Y19DRAFT_493302 [Xylariaceae sp. FL1651]